MDSAFPDDLKFCRYPWLANSSGKGSLAVLRSGASSLRRVVRFDGVEIDHRKIDIWNDKSTEAKEAER